MLQSVFTASGIQGIAVGQKGKSALLFAEIRHSLGIVGTQKCEISQLAEMHFNGYKLSVHIQVLDSRRNAEAFELIQLAGTHRTAEIRKINGGFFHNCIILSLC